MNVAPRSGRGAGHVDVVADQDRCPRGPVRVQPAAPVGEHDRAASGRSGGAHAVHHGLHTPALVEVRAPEEYQRPAPRRRGDAADLPRMPGDGRRGEPVQVGGGELRQGLAEQVDGRQPSGAEYQGQVVARRSGELRELGRGLGGSGGGVVEGHRRMCRHGGDAIPRKPTGAARAATASLRGPWQSPARTGHRVGALVCPMRRYPCGALCSDGRAGRGRTPLEAASHRSAWNRLSRCCTASPD